MSHPPTSLLAAWLERQLRADAWRWLSMRREQLVADFTDRALQITFGMVPRRVGKADLSLDPADRDAAEEARPGWDPREWSVADASRVLVLLETAGAGAQPFPDRFGDLCRTADVGEGIALYRGLALYPDAPALEAQAGEGLRSNMRAVFEAVAHHSPFPREQFDEGRWNQMVLKALFIGSALHPIQGLDERANPELARILCDYAHERWAADRPLSPELWRCVGPFAADSMVDDLARALRSTSQAERKAAAIALASSPANGAREALTGAGDLARSVERGELDWDRLVSEIA